MTINFNPFPIITSERLLLRQVDMGDASEIFVFRSDERILKYISTPKASTIDDALEHLDKVSKGIANNQLIYWGIILRESNKLIGSICLWNISKENCKAELGYVLHPDFQGIGIMNEALNKVLDFGFNVMKLHTIEAYTRRQNNGSINLLKRDHFKLIEDLRPENLRAENPDLVIYSLVNLIVQINESK